MKVALHSEISDGAIDEYRENHQRIPAELRAVFDEAGIHEWLIWRSGNRLFHYIDCDDFHEAMRVVSAAGANDRWQTHIGQFVAGFRDADGTEGFEPLELIWGLAAQREAEHTG